MRSDDELIEEYIAGEQDAFALLIERYLKQVYNVALRIVTTTYDAEDITQETFVKVWRNISKYRRGENFRAWLFKIARNTAIDNLRKRGDLSLSEFQDYDDGDAPYATVIDPSPTPYEATALADERTGIENYLQKLSLGDREILLFHYRDGLTFREIGDILGESLNTAKSRHRRALESLRKLACAPKERRDTY